MIRFTGDDKNGARLIGIGLTRADCMRLLDREITEIDIQKDLNVPLRGTIMLVAGETNADIARGFADAIDPDAQIHVDPALEPPEEEPPALPEKLHMDVNAERGPDGVLMVRFDLGLSLRRFGLPPDQARQLAAAIVEIADQIDAGTLS